MKNIADVNSEEILSELNNLDYSEDDLKLLDDEDIKPVNNISESVDLDNFDFGMEIETPKIDMYTEQEIKEIDAYIHKKTELKLEQASAESTKDVIKKNNNNNIDMYLNRNNDLTTIKVNKQEIIKPTENIKKKTIEQNPVIAVSEQKNESKEENLNSLFDKVSSNVKEASDIVNKNNEIKRKIEAKIEELKKIEKQHEENKRKDYEEINKYKEEVYSMLQQKKINLEMEINSLKDGQDKLAKDKAQFEVYKNNEMANLNRLEAELKNSYETRNRNIEQVEVGLVKRKEQLDQDRELISKEREKVNKEKEDLTNKLVQFNKLVNDFTNGIDNFN